MACEFDASKCTISCPKYPMCVYRSIQEQILSINEQLSLIYKYIERLEAGTNSAIQAMKQSMGENVSLLLDLISDSEKNKEIP